MIFLVETLLCFFPYLQVLKLYAWEESFIKMVLGIRDEELNVMRKSALLNVSTSFLWRMGSYLVRSVDHFIPSFVHHFPQVMEQEISARA